MKYLLIILLSVARIYIFCRVIYLLYMTHTDPGNFPIESLTWWIYYLIFDIWLSHILPKEEKTEES